MIKSSAYSGCIPILCRYRPPKNLHHSWCFNSNLSISCISVYHGHRCVYLSVNIRIRVIGQDFFILITRFSDIVLDGPRGSDIAELGKFYALFLNWILQLGVSYQEWSDKLMDCCGREYFMGCIHLACVIGSMWTGLRAFPVNTNGTSSFGLRIYILRIIVILVVIEYSFITIQFVTRESSFVTSNVSNTGDYSCPVDKLSKIAIISEEYITFWSHPLRYCDPRTMLP